MSNRFFLAHERLRKFCITLHVAGGKIFTPFSTFAYYARRKHNIFQQNKLDSIFWPWIFLCQRKSHVGIYAFACALMSRRDNLSTNRDPWEKIEVCFNIGPRLMFCVVWYSSNKCGLHHEIWKYLNYVVRVCQWWRWNEWRLSPIEGSAYFTLQLWYLIPVLFDVYVIIK